MNVEDISTLTSLSRREARRRARVAVAVYAVCLVALLAVASYLAPTGTIEPGPGEIAETSRQAR